MTNKEIMVLNDARLELFLRDAAPVLPPEVVHDEADAGERDYIFHPRHPLLQDMIARAAEPDGKYDKVYPYTIIEGDEGRYLVEGWRVVNREGYLFATKYIPLAEYIVLDLYDADGGEHDMKDGIITGVFAPETFWMKTLDLYDGEIEVSPVAVLNGRNEPDFGVYNREDVESYMEVTSMDPPHLWSAYLHQKEGFVDCIGDFTRYQDALEFAEAASAAVKRGKVLKVDSIAVEPQVDRNKSSDNMADYLPAFDVIGYEKAAEGETPDIWAVLIQDMTNMAEWEWELLDDFATEQEARDYAAAVIKRGWC